MARAGLGRGVDDEVDDPHRGIDCVVAIAAARRDPREVDEQRAVSEITKVAATARDT